MRGLLSSGYSAHEATSHFTGKGLAGFVEKPFRPRELLDRLRAVLEAPGDVNRPRNLMGTNPGLRRSRSRSRSRHSFWRRLQVLCELEQPRRDPLE